MYLTLNSKVINLQTKKYTKLIHTRKSKQKNQCYVAHILSPTCLIQAIAAGVSESVSIQILRLSLGVTLLKTFKLRKTWLQQKILVVL